MKCYHQKSVQINVTRVYIIPHVSFSSALLPLVVGWQLDSILSLSSRIHLPFLQYVSIHDDGLYCCNNNYHNQTEPQATRVPEGTPLLYRIKKYPVRRMQTKHFEMTQKNKTSAQAPRPFAARVNLSFFIVEVLLVVVVTLAVL